MSGLRKPSAAPATRPPIACALAECSNLVARGQEYSFIVTLATRGPDARLAAFQCPDVEELTQGNFDAQHFCCSIECAAKAAILCVIEDLTPRHQAEVAAWAERDLAAHRWPMR